jgi:D-alanyl-D-alanine carboxypeptidase
VKIANSPPPFPAPLPIVISHNASRDIDQGSAANPPAPQFATAQTATAQTATAYADPTRGAPPTTLGAQAQALEAVSTQPQLVASASSVPVPPASVPQNKTSPRSGWIIQVGALESESQARARLNAARDHASKLLNHADPFTETVSKGRKTLYRARFAGLDQSSAEAACRTLKRSDIGCIAIRN